MMGTSDVDLAHYSAALTRASFEASRAHDPGCLRCQQDRHVCPGCGSPANHAGTVVGVHDPACVALEVTRP